MDIRALVLFFGLVALFVIRAWKAHGYWFIWRASQSQ
jgi:hypothetical protein